MNHPINIEGENALHVNLVMLPVALVVSAGIGAIAAYISYNFFSLVLVFPIIMGGVAGALAQKVVYRTDGKWSWWAAILGVVLALLLYAVYRYGDYYLTFEEFGTRIKAIATFRNYLDWSAEQGINISRTSSSSGGFNLEGREVWIYWGVEVAIILFMGLFTSQSQNKDQEEVEEVQA